MKVILLADVKGQGKKNDVIEVSDGYGKNFLIPRKLAKAADNQSMTELKNKQFSAQHKIDVERANAKALAEKLTTLKVIFKVGSSADGRLYGSITAKDVAEKLDLKAQKMRQRKDEAKAHQRNIRTGKK